MEFTIFVFSNLLLFYHFTTLIQYFCLKTSQIDTSFCLYSTRNKKLFYQVYTNSNGYTKAGPFTVLLHIRYSPYLFVT